MSTVTYTYTNKGVTYERNEGGATEVVDCIFCSIKQHKEPATIIYEDSNFVVFKTIQPASKLHLLVIPTNHIQNLDDLIKAADADLVKDMVEIGRKAVNSVDKSATEIQFCFHKPPWNSIDHLHLHAIAYPNEMNMEGFFKYNSYLPFCELADRAISRLSKVYQRINGNGNNMTIATTFVIFLALLI